MEPNPYQSPEAPEGDNPRVRPYSTGDAMLLGVGCIWLVAVGVGTAMALSWLFSG